MNLGVIARLKHGVVTKPYLKTLRYAVKFLQEPLAALISRLRAPKSQEGYAKLGGKSPLREITENQAAALEQGLQERGLDAKVYVGMRYWKPFIEDAMEKVSFFSWPWDESR